MLKGKGKQIRRKVTKGGNSFSILGKQTTCPNCGSKSYGKAQKNMVDPLGGDRFAIKGKFCRNCGYNKPPGVLL